MFLILPACVVTAVWLERTLRYIENKENGRVGIRVVKAGSVVVLSFITAFIFLLPHRIIPLLPKTAFVSAVAHGHWRFLLPMTGGSGPLGFYLPVDALAFIVWAGLSELFLLFILIIAILLVLPLIAIFGWSLFMVPVFNLAPLTYSQACGLLILTGWRNF